MIPNEEYLRAMRADAIPEAESGLWKISKFSLAKPFETKDGSGNVHLIPPGRYTSLTRWTDATIHLGMGELVMHDFPYELKKHLIFARRAHGRVLITGLGLGCIARAVRINPNVESVTVIEMSGDVLAMVAPHMPPGFEIIQADAVDWTEKTDRRFDCAWHDLWAEDGDDHLQLQHMKMITNLKDVPMQGAWELPRMYRRLCRENGII
jgi:hypothetical protein